MPKIEATPKGVACSLTAEDRRHLEYVHTKIGRFLVEWMRNKAAVAQAADSLVKGVDAVRKAMAAEEAAYKEVDEELAECMKNRQQPEE